MRRVTPVVAVALAMSLAAAAVAGQVAVKKMPAKPMHVADADAKIGEVLKTKKVSFDFVDTPLQDAVAFMRQVLDVNMVLDPAVNGKQALTLRVNDMPAGRALQWMAKVGGGEMKIQDGAVYFAATPKAKARRMAFQGAKARAYHRPVGRAQIKLGDVASIDLQLYDDDLPDETREMLLKLLHKALARELAKLQKAKK